MGGSIEENAALRYADEMNQSLRNLRIIGLSFIPVMVGGIIAHAALKQGWQEIDGQLSRTGGWVAGALGVLGVIAAIWWRGRVTERPVTPEKATTSFFLTIAVAELSMLTGFVFTILSHGARPFYVGLAFFAVALTIMLISLNQIEVLADGEPMDLIR